MNRQHAIKIIRHFLEQQFPRQCACCERTYDSLADYIDTVTPIGRPLSYDAEEEDWRPQLPRGTLAMANCPCGSTMSVSSEGMPLITMWRLLSWARRQARREGVGMRELLQRLRGQIHSDVLSPRDGAVPRDPAAGVVDNGAAN